MWRALALVVAFVLLAGTYVTLAGDLSGAPPAPQESVDPAAKSFGFALAAGAVALAATLLVSQPRRRLRR